jgi:hypothetical protein
MAIAGLYSMGGRFYRSSMTLIVITKSMLFHSCTLVLKFWCNLKILFGASPNLLNIQTNILINSENIKYWCRNLFRLLKLPGFSRLGCTRLRVVYLRITT